MSEIALPQSAEALDLPAGTGRNSDLLAQRGYGITVADLDGALVEGTIERLLASGARCRGLVIDASHALPFPKDSFDLVLVIDFVDEYLLANVGRLIRPGGYLIHESYSDRGGNWRQLLPPRRTMEIIAPMFEIMQIEAKAAGPSRTEAETVKLLARRRGPR